MVVEGGKLSSKYTPQNTKSVHNFGKNQFKKLPKSTKNESKMELQGGQESQNWPKGPPKSQDWPKKWPGPKRVTLFYDFLPPQGAPKGLKINQKSIKTVPRVDFFSDGLPDQISERFCVKNRTKNQ